MSIKKIIVLLISLKVVLSWLYADNTEEKMKEMIELMSKGLAKKEVMPVSLQVIDKNKYLMFERNAPLNRIAAHYGAEKTKDVSTNCFVSSVQNGERVSNNKKSVNNVNLFKINKMYRIDDNYIAVGYDQNLSLRTTHQATVIQTDKRGQTLWKRVVGIGKSYAEAMSETLDNGFVVLGYDFVWQSTDKSRGNYHILVTKLNKSGKTVWSELYAVDGGFARGRNIEKTSDGGYIVVGEIWDRAWIFKIDSSGKKIWEVFHDIPRTKDIAYAVSGNGQDGYLIAGITNISGAEGLKGDKTWVMKVSHSGKKEWISHFKTGVPYDLMTVHEISPEEFTVTGFSYSFDSGKKAVFFNVDTRGNIISEKTISLN